jgi:hypothetical protein
MAVYEVLLFKTARKQLAHLPIVIHDKLIESISNYLLYNDPPGVKN